MASFAAASFSGRIAELLVFLIWLVKDMQQLPVKVDWIEHDTIYRTNCNVVGRCKTVIHGKDAIIRHERLDSGSADATEWVH